MLLGCTPAPSPSPSVTAPPVPADFVPWPDIVWAPAEGVNAAGPADAEQVTAVTAGPDGFVAVGYREIGAVRDGLIWHSPDGEAWVPVGAPGVFDGVELLDVAPAPGGFVALGVGTLGAAAERPQAVFYRSLDGRAWERLEQVPGSAETYPDALAGGLDGVVAAGTDADGEPVLWRSDDGRLFERVAIAGASGGAIVDPQPIAGGFVALGSTSGPPMLLRSTDAQTWAETVIDGAPDVVASRLVPGRWGYVVQGLWAPRCSSTATVACGGQAIGWWSGDASGWGRLPDGSPISNGASIVVAAGEHGLLAIDGASAWASPDGWAWRALPEPGDGSMSVSDAVVRADVIVAVGALFGEDGASRGAIVVGR